jgi:hypothetical protein
MLKSWANLPGYHEFVKDKWQSFQVHGWGGFVLKEKLKLLKGCLKEWQDHHGRNLAGRLKDVKERRLALEVKGEVEDLGVSERDELLFLSSQVFSLSRMQCSNQLQQSRLMCLKEGDANSKKIHGVLSSRRRVNTLSHIVVNDVVVEGVPGI